ncbi:glycosyltransferase family 4 protein [Acetobacter sp.]|jgi:glycosyltransferase involved in cell wall biosynthesis|uniref:glycosyltransferase family 4 protein n=1 Tax=Acetobacter sp. TaxID=440 RepID=UPI0025C3F784|nr:glycosyltransferase family 1 protein [Acetobacter sp.]MCH4091490.1 glycosyltransferase family 4 protein [Acetobacter sp.]MCI1299468.1 glycosyltransferase family 4 protein [Acetobacter sp.]MCI1316942.1 glycosyltransferase family 4 protein [Acetobacter sp.]
MIRSSSQCTIRVDVDDLFQYAMANPRPSGIQRVVHEILSVLEARALTHPQQPRILFVRCGRNGDPFAEVSWSDIADLFSTLTGTEQTVTGQGGIRRSGQPLLRQPQFGESLRRTLISKFQSMPEDIGKPLLASGIAQMRAIRLLRRCFRPARNRPAASHMKEAPELFTSDPKPFSRKTTSSSRKDVFLALGAAWCDPLFSERLHRAREQYGVHPVLLIHDLIPFRHPEWCDPSLVRNFQHWLRTSLPYCSRLLAVSSATARDVEHYATEHGLELPSPVPVMPMGSGFSSIPMQSQTIPVGLPATGSYVLFVSTLEARKNHTFLLRVWRRLLGDGNQADIPTLIFAGRVGWMVRDLMQQLDNSDWLDGKIRLISDPTDEELKHLYQNSLFTIFPSLSEGWGLPVSESLMMGTPCLASHSSSLPEAGGQFARYFDPENVTEAVEKIRDLLGDHEKLSFWKNEIRTGFTPTSWEKSADMLLDACLATSCPEARA